MVRLRLAAMVAACLPGLFMPTGARAAAEWFAIDPVHTRVLFLVEHARFSRSIGLFRSIDGGLWFDPDDWSNGRVDVCLSLDHLDMGNRGWEEALRRPDFFDARKHPEICFRSSRVERIDDSRGRLHGEIDIRGTTRPAVFEFTVNDLRRFSLTMKRRLGVSATTTFSRADFGMTRDKTLIGDAVEVMVELEAQRADPLAPDSHPSKR
jgi:polyisoprenoid-binding protein YceI